MRGLSGATRLALFVGAGFFSYTCWRAARIPVTHDEAFTYNEWVSRSVGAILRLDGKEPANNHLLNTLLAKCFVNVFGPSVIALRLPNLLAHASFLFFTWRLLSRAVPPAIALAGFVLTNANPLLLEMFSLSRGYGLALAFVAPALFYAVLSFEGSEGSPRDETWAASLLAAGVFAQFVTLDVFVAVVTAFTLFRIVRLTSRRYQIAERFRALLRESTGLLLAALFLTATAGPAIAFLRRSGQLYAGGRAGFWKDGVGSLVWLTLLGFGPDAERFVRIAVAATLAALLLLAAVLAARRTGPAERTLFGLLLVLLLSAAATSLQHAAFGTNYPTDRTALVFLPLFTLALAAGIGAAVQAWPRARSSAGLALGMSAALALALVIRRTGVPASSLWWFDADDERILEDVSRLRSGRPGEERPVRLATTWLLEPSLNFYRRTRGLYWLEPFDREGPWVSADYAAILGQDESDALRRGYVVLKRYSLTGNLLIGPPAPLRISAD